jgi:hypothetical protein
MAIKTPATIPNSSRMKEMQMVQPTRVELCGTSTNRFGFAAPPYTFFRVEKTDRRFHNIRLADIPLWL